jgi:hypothetical protein
MPIEVSSSPKRIRFVLWLVFSFVLLSNTAGMPLTGLRVRASSDPAYADVNGDGAVDILDIITVAIAFGSDPEHPKWDSRADVNNDDIVDIFDVMLISSNFSNSDSTSNAREPAKLQNCVWMLPYELLPWSGHYSGGLGNELDNPQYMIDRLDGLSIDCVIVRGGTWKSDGTISYDPGTTFVMWKNFIDAMKTWNPNIKVLVWVFSWDSADLSNPSIRDTMYNSAKQLLSAVPFDGWNEDYEGWSGETSHAITFYQGIASAVKSMGKIATIATEVEWGGYHIEDYASLTNFDYIMPMFYAHVNLSNAKYYWDKILAHSPVPVIMGLAVLLKQNGGTPLAEQLAWIDTQSHTNLAGFSLWAYDYMTYEDFDAWKNWKTKDTIGVYGGLSQNTQQKC